MLIFAIVILFTMPIIKKTEENFTTPTAVNVPAGGNLEGKSFFVGNKYFMKNDEPIVDSHGKYKFKKQRLLYDGIWEEKCNLDGKGFEKCNWYNSYDNPANIYGTNNFFQYPEKKMDTLYSGKKIIDKNSYNCEDVFENSNLENSDFENISDFSLPKLSSF